MTVFTSREHIGFTTYASECLMSDSDAYDCIVTTEMVVE